MFKILILLVLILVALILTLVPIQTSAPGGEGGSGAPLVIAHRGASGTAPENTLPAIDAALAAGADYIEIDVHLSLDRDVIVIHDATVDRTTDGKGRVNDLTSGYIRTLDAGSWFDEAFRGAVVPTLGEVLDLVDGKAKLLIEIKKRGKQNEGIEDEVIRLIRTHDALDWCEVQSFNDRVLLTMHRKAPEIPLHKLIVFKYRFIPYVFDGRITRFSFEKYAFVKSINMHYRFFKPAFAEKIHGHDKQIFLWGCRDEKPCIPLYPRLWDGWITDYPLIGR